MLKEDIIKMDKLFVGDSNWMPSTVESWERIKGVLQSVEAEEDCPHCEGDPKIEYYDNKWICFYCHGTGKIHHSKTCECGRTLTPQYHCSVCDNDE